MKKIKKKNLNFLKRKYLLIILFVTIIVLILFLLRIYKIYSIKKNNTKISSLVVASDLCYGQLITKYMTLLSNEIDYYNRNPNYFFQILLNQGYDYSNLSQGIYDFVYNKGELIINSEEYINLKKKCNFLYSDLRSKIYDLKGWDQTSTKKADEVKILINDFFSTFDKMINETENLHILLKNLDYDKFDDYQIILNSSNLARDIKYKREILYEKLKEITEKN